MSETVAFRHEATPGPRHPNRAGFGLTYSNDAVAYQTLADAYAERRSGDARQVQARPRYKLPGAGGIYWATYSDRTAASVTLGLGVAGIDLTHHVGGRAYLSVSGSAIAGAQVSWLHRAVNAEGGGVLVGPSARRSTYLLSSSYTPCDYTMVDEFGCSGDPNLETLSFGLKGTAFARTGVAQGEFGRGVLGSVYVGYAPEYRAPLITFGASLGAF